MRAGSFVSDRHLEAFERARLRTQRGGEQAAICGARTRGNGICRHPPLKGGRRCLRHAGPHAARAHRERQLHDLALGRITFGAFVRAEAKRAINKLRWEWKKNPWHPGQTIDLGTFEERFLIESGIARLGAGAHLPPAVLDWLRWRYRRLRIDRKRDEEWLRVLREDYPRRVRDAGSPTEDMGSATAASIDRPLWTAGRTLVGSKRQRLDAPRLVVAPPPRQLQEHCKVPEDEADHNKLALIVAEHRDTLGPLLGRCRSENERRTVIMALLDYLAAPDDAGTGTQWRDVVTELWSR